MDAFDEPLRLLDRLARNPRPATPSMLIPAHIQWRMVDFAVETWAASTVLNRPEFGPKVKFSVRQHASLEARAAWLATDPNLSDGDYLLESLAIAQHPRGGSTPIHALGNRPSLVVPILELGLTPLYPAAARHTRTLQEHAALIDALAHVDPDDPAGRWAADVFASRTDVPWPMRNRAKAESSFAGAGSRSDIEAIAMAWDAIAFTEAGAPISLLSDLPTAPGSTRRAAALVMMGETSLPDSVVAAARSTGQRIVAAQLTAAAAVHATQVEPAPRELIATIGGVPLNQALTGERAPAPHQTPSTTPVPRSRPRVDSGEMMAAAAQRTYRAMPDGTVIDVTDPDA